MVESSRPQEPGDATVNGGDSVNTTPHDAAIQERWTLEGRIPLSAVAEGAAWHRARSVTTGEKVVLFIVHGAAALETADAARRAYLVEDARLLPVRDVAVFGDDTGAAEHADHGGGADGTADHTATVTTPETAHSDEPTTVVEYPMPPAPPLAALLSDGSLRPETARSIIGEAAQGLEAARRRGVRHQFLDSNRVFVDVTSGAVHVLGVGVEAASHPDLDRSGSVASFQDTAALAALLYRSLTGKPPRPDASGDVPTASAVAQRPVPQDLDELCDLVLNERADSIPETTRELITELEPWQSIPVTLEAYDPYEASTHHQPNRDPESRSDADRTPESAPAPPMEPRAGSDAEPGSETTASNDPEATAPLAPDTATPLAAAAALGVAGSAAAMNGGAHTAPAPGAHERMHDADDLEATAAMPVTPSDPTGGPTAEDETVVDAADDRDPAREQESAPAQVASHDESQRAAVQEQNGQDAQALVSDLHLTQKRSTAAFPGHLDISPPHTTAPAPAAADSDSAGGSASASGNAGVAGTGAASATAGVAGAGVAGASAAAAAPSNEAVPGGEPAPESHGQRPDNEASTPQGAAEASGSQERAGSVPVIVRGRNEPVTGSSGPIVVPGRSEPVPRSGEATWTRGGLLRDVVSIATDSDDSDSSFTTGPQQPEARDRQSHWILLGAALLVIIALVFALSSITSGLRERIMNPLGTTAPASQEPSPAASDDGAEEAPAEEEPEQEPSAPAPTIENVEVIDSGSSKGPDNADQAPRMTDGDPGTFWSTKHYKNANFGGLKETVSVRVTFAEPSTLTAVTVTTARNTGGAMELRPLDADGNPGEPIATGQFAGDGEVRLAPDAPVEASGLEIVVTELPPDSRESGRFRARIAEIRVE